jgi:predicted dehydrogenase
MKSRRLVFGLIGCGIYGKVHAGVIQNDTRAKLKGLWSFTRARGEMSARMLGCRQYGTWRELVGDTEIDCVSITTPDFAHTEYALAALDAGKHVLLEKPMAMSANECRRIIAARDASGKTLMVNYHNRWYPAFIAARDAIMAGTIGIPAAASFVLSDTISWVERNMKWADRSGPEWFLMSHIADLACWMLGDRPSEVFAMAREGLLKSKGYDTRDLVTATARMTGGAVVQLETSWILARNWRNPVNDMRIVIHGEEGRIDIVADYENLAVTADRYLTPYTLNEHTEARPIRDFITCVLEAKPPPVSGEDGLLATRVIQAVVRSYTENRTVRMGEIV